MTDHHQAERALIRNLTVRTFKVPTTLPEADGTIEWDSTVMILVSVTANGRTGIGYTYAHPAAGMVIQQTLKSLVIGKDVMQLPAITQAMTRAIRNNGTCGLSMMAVSAVDNALWDLKAKVLGLPLVSLLGQVKEDMPLYGSGGFTSYNNDELEKQLSKWAEQGIKAVKMKIGAHPEKDEGRVKAARNAIGNETGLFIDANGAYTAKQAVEKAHQFEKYNITWFEEPVSSDDLRGLNFVRHHAPANMHIAAGEYGYNLPYFESMLHAEAVDVLQGDATRCGGISGFLKAGVLCEAYIIPYSSHCAPAQHLHAALSLPAFHVAEYFSDHVRIENMFFDGVPQPVNGALRPDMSRFGIGLELKEADVKKFEI